MDRQPELLLLDEPTAQLDPIAASEFVAALVKINRELGVTVIIVEHRLEEVVPAADRLFVMEGGRLLLSGSPRSVSAELHDRPELLLSMPAAVRFTVPFRFADRAGRLLRLPCARAEIL